MYDNIICYAVYDVKDEAFLSDSPLRNTEECLKYIDEHSQKGKDKDLDYSIIGYNYNWEPVFECSALEAANEENI